MKKYKMEEYIKNIGKGVIKKNISRDTITKCKFKSGGLINTIKGVIEHPILKIPAYTFEEDESYVECRRCLVIVDDENHVSNIIYLNNDEYNRGKLAKIFGQSKLTFINESTYLSFNLKTHEWKSEFDYAWLYREQPPITSIEVLIKSLLYNE